MFLRRILTLIGIVNRLGLPCVALTLLVGASIPTRTIAQQAAPPPSANTDMPSEPIAKKQVRRAKRGGLPGDNTTNATPAEGQSDLIKVLQPGQRTK